MSEPSRSKVSLVGWAMVNNKGEVMSDDDKSDSRGSTPELEDSTASTDSTVSLPLPHEANEAHVLQDLTSQSNQHLSLESIETNEEETDHQIDFRTLQLDDPSSENDNQVVENLQPVSLAADDSEPTDVDPLVCSAHPTSENCPDMTGFDMGSSVEHNIGDTDIAESYEQEGEDVEVEEMEERGLSPFDPISMDIDDIDLRERRNSDSDSDFVQINEDNVAEYENRRLNNVIPQGSPSIAEEFNFLREADDDVRDDLSNRDADFEDFNEDTESSTEDNCDDRIESDQSDVGSLMNTGTDVGDLSAFADISNLPIEAGNVARNYRHRPNNRLSSVLNVVLSIVAVLTMGISIGLIMATDQEIEEWQTAYNIQLEKVYSLEWTIADLTRVLRDSKDRAAAYDSVVKSFSKAGDSSSREFFSNFDEIVKNFDACSQKTGSLSTVNCHATILKNVQNSLARFRQAVTVGQTDDSIYLTGGGKRQTNEDDFMIHMKTKTIEADHQKKLQELQLSLTREQERAAHWQNLYLLERRQREWERENDDLEDRLARDQWEKEDLEQDRKEREEWEREEAEEDKRDRLMWEKLDKEEDKRDREQWEKERAELDSMECLKKLMNTNLTFLGQKMVPNWNISAFEDFVNMSLLISSITEMKRSVLNSVQQIWIDSEQMLKKMTEEVKNGKKSYLDTSVMANYLKQALGILKSQAEDFINVQHDAFNQDAPPNNGDKSERKTKPPKSKQSDEKEKSVPDNWNKAIKKMFKQTSKSLRKFMRTLGSSWTGMKTVWIGKEPEPEIPLGNALPKWLSGDTCKNVWKLSAKENKNDITLDLGLPCAWKIRNRLNKILKKKCQGNNQYSHECNKVANSVWGIHNDLKQIFFADEQFRSGEIVLSERWKLIPVFENFLKKWENNEMLLKPDKDWVSCLSYELSRDVGNEDFGVDISNRCSRLVSLDTLLKEVEKRYVNAAAEDDDDDDYDDDDNGNNEDDDDAGDEEDGHDKIFVQIPKLKELSYEVDWFSHVYHNDNNDDDDDDKDEYEDHKNNLGNSNDYKKKLWYLKRAQYRMEMRKAQKKHSWFFDMSSHRDEMRKEHNVEIKSAQWLFDQAADRAEHRRKEHESDWLFERAQYRNRKHASEQFDDIYSGHERRKKYKFRDNLDKNKQHSKYSKHHE